MSAIMPTTANWFLLSPAEPAPSLSLSAWYPRSLDLGQHLDRAEPALFRHSVSPCSNFRPPVGQSTLPCSSTRIEPIAGHSLTRPVLLSQEPSAVLIITAAIIFAGGDGADRET